MSQRRDGVRWRRVLLVVIALFVINVPYGGHLWELHRAATEGVRVTATVVEVRAAGSDDLVTFKLPRTLDAKQTPRVAKVNSAAGAAAQRSQQIDVRVLRGHPSVFRVTGEVRSWGGLLITIGADLMVLVMILLSWRLGGRIRRPELIGVALEDVRTGEEGSLLDKQDDGTYLVNGEVAASDPSSVRLSLRDRDVTIHLRDHSNPVPVGARACVRAHLVG